MQARSLPPHASQPAPPSTKSYLASPPPPDSLFRQSVRDRSNPRFAQLSCWAFPLQVQEPAPVRARIFRSQTERDEFLLNLKLTQCPHCKKVGTLNRHGVLRGYDENNFRHKSIRARRVFCSNRNQAAGCGRTFSVWIADKVKRLFLSAEQLWTFLNEAAATDNKRQALGNLNSSMSDSAPYRIWKRFQKEQSSIRTALSTICPPPKLDSTQPSAGGPTGSTLAHLTQAFAGHRLNPIAAFQLTLQTFFI